MNKRVSFSGPTKEYICRDISKKIIIIHKIFIKQEFYIGIRVSGGAFRFLLIASQTKILETKRINLTNLRKNILQNNYLATPWYQNASKLLQC